MNRQMTLEEFGVSLKDPEAAAGGRRKFKEKRRERTCRGLP